MGIKDRISRIERFAGPPARLEQRTEILVNVTGPDEPERPRDTEGVPTLTPDEREAVRTGDTLCFIFGDEPRHVSFRPDGRGGVAVRTQG